ncbi:hypothetical protein QA640_27415 [Bradyrhizobium sp. CB82]|uniref:hypothetical protein n=1 Tax=Bradyrhizobium sp. CB82 TaxID=3039159 RepID=UPI0024B08A11|nr:hypothetical protein [Bradyrhizobium sp. CB82]WFU38153.1 hypothetical protein QA640_27415 [Bradyrhizobium sp. CB82]
MKQNTPEEFFTGVVDWNSLVSTSGAIPPRDPDDEDEDEEGEEDEDDEDEEDDEPAVVREPDED